jgi:UDP-GlcNAc:undecaprenyl-phosphate GlcNAc-1-phosphate transferase
MFRWLDVMDHPDGARKVHGEPIPRGGGLPILVACAGAYGLLLLLPLNASGTVERSLPLVRALLPAVLLMFLTGLLDDVFGLKPWQKLAGQMAAALLAYSAGVSIEGIGGYRLENWWWTLPLTVGWFLMCTNAFNLIDGVDGLAAGVGLFATLTMLVAALLRDNMALAMATTPLAASLLAFLRYNFNPASVFLGDSGSLLIGFLLGCYGVIWSQKTATVLGMTAPLMALAIPILDVGLAIVRRFLRGQKIFGADRRHIHHLLLDRGLTPRRVALLLYGFSGLFAGLSVLQSVGHSHYGGLILLLFCVVTWIGVQNLGYVEFRVARRMLLGGAFQENLNGQLALRRVEEKLEQAESVEECWQTLREACKDFGFVSVEMVAGGEEYYHRSAAAGEAAWQILIPIGENEWVNFTRAQGGKVLPMVVPFVDAVQSKLLEKLRAVEGRAVIETVRAGSAAAD